MPFFKENHFTIPESSPLFKPMPRFYKGYRKLSIFCKSSAAAIQSALPPGMTCNGEIIEIFVMHCPEVYDVANPVMGPRNYMEGGVVVPVRYGELEGGHVLYEYVDTDDSLSGGREVWGYPKKLGEVNFVESGDGSIRASVSRLGRTLIDAHFHPDENANFTKPALHPRIQVKRIPRADGRGYDVDQIIRNDLREPKIHQQTKGKASLNLGGNPQMDPLFALDIEEVIGADFVVAEFYLDYGTIYEDRLKPG